MRKLTSLALAILMMAVALPYGVFAMEPPVAGAMEVTTAGDVQARRWTATSSVARAISINGGSATMTVDYYTYDSTDKIYLTVEYQRASGTTYSTVATYTQNGSGNVKFSRTRTVSSGYNHRIKVTGEVYDKYGGYIETVELYSSAVYY